METNVAQNIVPVEVKPGVSLSTMTGTLNVKDNIHNIEVCTRDIYFFKVKLVLFIGNGSL